MSAVGCSGSSRTLRQVHVLVKLCIHHVSAALRPQVHVVKSDNETFKADSEPHMDAINTSSSIMAVYMAYSDSSLSLPYGYSPRKLLRLRCNVCMNDCTLATSSI